MNDAALVIAFDSRDDFRKWLNKNHDKANGVWIKFTKGSESFSANDALEEAICYGWIDGVMKSVDEQTYKKYFSKRKDTANWSDKNRSLFNKLNEQGIMTKYGVAAFQCELTKPIIDKESIHSGNIAILRSVLKTDKEVFNIFENLAISRQKQLAGFYCEAKTEETKGKRKIKIIEAIKSNSKKMLY